MTSAMRERLGRRIADARRSKGWTQQKLANAIDTHANTVARYERGEIDPTATQLRLLARALDVTADALLS